MKEKIAIGLMILGAILAAVLFATFIVMFAANLVLGHYNIKPLDFPAAFGLTVILAAIGGSNVRKD